MSKEEKAGQNPWAEAKKLCRLSARHVEMAKRLGMNPRSLPGLRPAPTQQWKAPVPVFIEDCYRKRFGDDAPLLTPPTRRKHEDDEPMSMADIGVEEEVQAGIDRAQAERQVLASSIHLANLEQVVSAALQRKATTKGLILDLADDLAMLAADLRAGREPREALYVGFDLDERWSPPVPAESDDEIPF